MTTTPTRQPTGQPTTGQARPPLPRGPFSRAVGDALARPPGTVILPDLEVADPLGDDEQLALYTCYELHYRGFAGVDPDWEWDLELLRLRRTLEDAFLTALRDAVEGGDDVEAALAPLLTEDPSARGVSAFLRDEGSWDHLREHLVHRSVYHLKEADPHAWVIPRLQGQAKASLVAVEYDEFGAGRASAAHSRLYADLMEDAGLDGSYLRYLNAVPAPALAIVNMMSLFGLRRTLRAAMVGHFAAAEITTAPSARRMEAALEKLGAGERALLFYTEHIEADAVHEQVLRHDVIGDLLAREPEAAADVVFGIQATGWLENGLERLLLGSWDAGRSSLREPLPLV
ncbi:iron-containing redox enzyme family protein [Actinocorallia sp. A-T 12471]|uniref:iron-containing redox enzyme family protein n=1 Tax=Actinocorallia sp. A-T 12471 TaxID=3089813 RepID=UPI0029CB736C|nr:iron-containing redox enzyme family protein [Actinocorallia sp. A-T 12471]MDX6742341.1 iron-containing redox enzyme family protein [Actinocorallia sp. A-T 12471]